MGHAGNEVTDENPTLFNIVNDRDHVTLVIANGALDHATSLRNAHCVMCRFTACVSYKDGMDLVRYNV